jgi:hypothetical protein
VVDNAQMGTLVIYLHLKPTCPELTWPQLIDVLSRESHAYMLDFKNNFIEK